MEKDTYRHLQPGHAYFIKKDQSRGLDFSGGEGGIDLLVAASLPNNRALQ